MLKILTKYIIIVVIFQLINLPNASVVADDSLSPSSIFDKQHLTKELWKTVRSGNQLIKLPPTLFTEIKAIQGEDYSIYFPRLSLSFSEFLGKGDIEWFILVNNKNNKIALINQDSHVLIQTDIDYEKLRGMEIDACKPIFDSERVALWTLLASFSISVVSKLSYLYESFASYSSDGSFAISMMIIFSFTAFALAVLNGKNRGLRESAIFFGTLSFFSLISGIASGLFPFIAIISVILMVQSLDASNFFKIGSNILNIALLGSLFIGSALFTVPLLIVAGLVLVIFGRSYFSQVFNFRLGKAKEKAFFYSALAFVALFCLPVQFMIVSLALFTIATIYAFLPQSDKEFYYDRVYKTVYDNLLSDYMKKNPIAIKKNLLDQVSKAYRTFEQKILEAKYIPTFKKSTAFTIALAS